MPKSATRQILHARSVQPLEGPKALFFAKNAGGKVYGFSRVPPPQSAEIPLVDEQFSSGPQKRQLTLSYRVLPPKGRKAAQYATPGLQSIRYRIERNATVHSLELTPLIAIAAENNNINQPLMVKTHVENADRKTDPGVSAGILGT
jgi:hypothetical protein